MQRFDLEGICAGIQADDPSATEQLYLLIRQSCRGWIFRDIGYDGPVSGEDCLQDVYLSVHSAIRRGEIRGAFALVSYARTIARRQMAAIITERIKARNNPPLDVVIEPEFDCESLPRTFTFGQSRALNPEQLMQQREQKALVEKALAKLNPQHRDILTRFYLDEQSWQQICVEMNLTETQFRLLKSRAKATFGDIGRRAAKQTVLKLPTSKAA